LLRLANTEKSKPSDVHHVSENIRDIIGSRESASHFRIGTNAIEFNLFVRSVDELVVRKKLLSEHGFEILSEKLLDIPPPRIGKLETLREGVQLFNEERFWESHEVLEQIWRDSRGGERDAIQGLILTAAAFVHYQKNEPQVFFSVIKRARAKLEGNSSIDILGFGQLGKKIDKILASGRIRVFKLKSIGS
jgi:uncharacterized protein